MNSAIGLNMIKRKDIENDTDIENEFYKEPSEFMPNVDKLCKIYDMTVKEILVTYYDIRSDAGYNTYISNKNSIIIEDYMKTTLNIKYKIVPFIVCNHLFYIIGRNPPNSANINLLNLDIDEDIKVNYTIYNLLCKMKIKVEKSTMTYISTLDLQIKKLLIDSINQNKILFDVRYLVEMIGWNKTYYIVSRFKASKDIESPATLYCFLIYPHLYTFSDRLIDIALNEIQSDNNMKKIKKNIQLYVTDDKNVTNDENVKIFEYNHQHKYTYFKFFSSLLKQSDIFSSSYTLDEKLKIVCYMFTINYDIISDMSQDIKSNILDTIIKNDMLIDPLLFVSSNKANIILGLCTKLDNINMYKKSRNWIYYKLVINKFNDIYIDDIDKYTTIDDISTILLTLNITYYNLKFKFKFIHMYLTHCKNKYTDINKELSKYFNTRNFSSTDTDTMRINLFGYLCKINICTCDTLLLFEGDTTKYHNKNIVKDFFSNQINLCDDIVFTIHKYYKLLH